MHDEEPDLVENRDDRDGEVRRVRAVAPGRLPVAADPEAGEREDERREAERRERGGVDDESGEEPADRAGDAAAQERDRDERDEEQFRPGAVHVDLGEDRDLRHRRHEEQDGDLHAIQGAHVWCFLVGTRTETAASELRSANGCTSTCRNDDVSVAWAYVTLPIGIPAGYRSG